MMKPGCLLAYIVIAAAFYFIGAKYPTLASKVIPSASS